MVEVVWARTLEVSIEIFIAVPRLTYCFRILGIKLRAFDFAGRVSRMNEVWEQSSSIFDSGNSTLTLKSAIIKSVSFLLYTWTE